MFLFESPALQTRIRNALALSIVTLASAVATPAEAAATLSHGPELMFHDGYEGTTAGPFNDSDASRFLTQATFGPTDTDIATLRSQGYAAWLNVQFAATPTYELDYMDWTQNTLLEDAGENQLAEAWVLGAMGGPDPQNNAIIHNDQLRQRVAFALSEIFVVSDQNAALSGHAKGMAYYYDILIRNAFGNYRQLLDDITLSPAMGVYLNMLSSRRADLSKNLHPDENYGREINQLFSVGLVMLKIDGTPLLSGGQPIPTYTQSTITSFAHVFTGWNWADCDSDGYDHFADCQADYPSDANFRMPMVAYDQKDHPRTGNPSYHDNGSDAVNDVHSKQLLSYTGAVNGGVLADNGTAASDLKFALDNIFNHPNVGPFISKQLIQRLVTSNPTPAYVQRVATVFNDNGSGVRGDLKAVVTAILLDSEARLGQWQHPDTFGKLREPLLTMTHFWRAMHALHACGQNIPVDGDNAATMYAGQPYRYGGYYSVWRLDSIDYGGVGQRALDAFTVFNFFRPSFMPSGELATRGLVAPEFQLQGDSVIANTNNTFTNTALYGNEDVNDVCDAGDTFGDVKINHAQDLALAATGTGGAADPADRLVDAYNKRFMSGQMSPYMRQTLLTYLNSLSSTSYHDTGTDWRLLRTSHALYMIITSPEYMIQK